MVPPRAGVWAEVKTLAVGEVVAGDGGPPTTALSYFSRLTDAEAFGRLATVETHRRGTTTAGTVVAGSDWLGVQAHALRHGDEHAVLAALADLAAEPGLRAEAQAVVSAVDGYLSTRREQIRYRAFATAGYPLGSGCVESANKLVVETRLKGPGMHWARPNVDLMLARRNLLANGRWAVEWPTLWRSLRTGRNPRRVVPAPPPRPFSPPPPAPVAPPVSPAPRLKLVVNGKPTTAHPWKRGLTLRANA